MQPQDFDDLIRRLEADHSADRQLDWRLSWALDLAPWAGEERDRLDFCMVGSKRDKQTLRLTSSIDDALLAISALKSDLNGVSPADFLRDALDEMMTRGWRPEEPNAPQIARAIMTAAVRQVALNHSPVAHP